MKQAGRKRWNVEDYNAAVRTLNELCPPTDAEAAHARARLQVKQSRPASRTMPTRAELMRLYVKRRLSIRDVAVELDCTRDMVHRALHVHGIEARPQGERRSALGGIPLERLQGMVERLGLRGAARELGVDHGNLARHLRNRKQ